MTRIFFIAPLPRFDVSAAQNHGAIHFLFEDVYSINPLSGQAAIDQIEAALEKAEFDPDEDVIALTGPVSLVAMLAIVASSFGFDQQTVQTLVFDARGGGSYRPRVLALPGGDER